MEAGVVLTQILPEGAQGRSRQSGELLALGVSQLLLGALQVTLGGALWGALWDPLAAQLGAPLATGPLLMLSGSLLVGLDRRPSVGLSRASLALGILSSIASFLALLLQGFLLPHGCPTCLHLAPSTQLVVLGAHGFLMTSSVGAAALAITGTVAAARAGDKGGGAPVVIYQTALPSAQNPAPLGCPSSQ